MRGPVDLAKAIARLFELARVRGDGGAARRLLANMGSRVLAQVAADAASGILFVIAPPHGGTVSLYEQPAEIVPELHASLTRLSGQRFSKLEDRRRRGAER